MESETATTEENLEDNDTLSSEVTDQSIDNSDETTDADHQNINPNSEEAKVNEKLKENIVHLCLVKERHKVSAISNDIRYVYSNLKPNVIKRCLA